MSQSRRSRCSVKWPLIFLFSFLALYASSQSTLYSEQFNTNWINNDPVSWTRSVANAGNIPPSSKFFFVTGNRMEANDVGVEVVWYSKVINISGQTDVTVSGKFWECGTMEAGDYIRAYYILDGGSETQFFAQVDDAGTDCSQLNGSVSSLTGTTIQVVVRALNGLSEAHRFDDIVVSDAVNGNLYTESFNTNDYNYNSPDWTTTVSGSTNITGRASDFRVENNKMVCKYADEEVTWTSVSINIAGYTNVTVSADFYECGTMEAGDYIKAYYSIDGGAQTLWFDQTDDNGTDCALQQGSVSNLTGNSLQIIIKISNGLSEEHRFDNVLVTGCGVVAGVASLAASPVDHGATAQLILTGEGAGTIQWQYSSDNSVFNDISGATTDPWSFEKEEGTHYYRAVVTNGACNAVSNTVTLTVSNTGPCGDCTRYISGAGAVTVTSGEVVCVKFGDTYSGNITIQSGGIFCVDSASRGGAAIKAVFSGVPYDGIISNELADNARINNYGTMNVTSFKMDGANARFYNYASGVVNATPLDMSSSSGAIHNYGDINVTGNYNQTGTLSFTGYNCSDLDVTGILKWSSGSMTGSMDITADSIYWTGGSFTPGCNITVNNGIYFGGSGPITIGGNLTAGIIEIFSVDPVTFNGTIDAYSLDLSSVDDITFNDDVLIATDFGVFSTNMEFNGCFCIGRDLDASASPITSSVACSRMWISGFSRSANSDWAATGTVFDFCDNGLPAGGFDDFSLGTDNTTKCGGCSNCGAMCSATLPVHLVAFGAIARETSVVLNWVTSTEINNDFFTIERSRNGSDFEVVAMVPGAGNSADLLKYKVEDHYPLSGLAYYRLKQTDFDGKFEYSNLVAVTFNGEQKFHVYPNPSNGEKVFLSYPDTPNGKVILYDITGKRIWETKLTEGGEEEFLLGQNIAPGIYWLSVENDRGILGRIKLLILD